jgi:hypothetical protein
VLVERELEQADPGDRRSPVSTRSGVSTAAAQWAGIDEIVPGDVGAVIIGVCQSRRSPRTGSS